MSKRRFCEYGEVRVVREERVPVTVKRRIGEGVYRGRVSSLKEPVCRGEVWSVCVR